MECPHITDREKIDSSCCKPMEYTSSTGEKYKYWQHTTPDGEVLKVQFCDFIGRKQDIFQCFNESEWKECPHAKGSE